MGRAGSPGWAPSRVGTAEGLLMRQWPEARTAAGRTEGRTHSGGGEHWDVAAPGPPPHRPGHKDLRLLGCPRAPGTLSSCNPLCCKSNLPVSALLHRHCPGKEGTTSASGKCRKAPDRARSGSRALGSLSHTL